MAGRPPRREYDGDAPGAPGGIMISVPADEQQAGSPTALSFRRREGGRRSPRRFMLARRHHHRQHATRATPRLASKMPNKKAPTPLPLEDAAAAGASSAGDTRATPAASGSTAVYATGASRCG